MADEHKPPHSTVRWKYRDSPDGCEYARHYDGPWAVEVCDQDGDRSYWSVSLNGAVISKGEVEERLGIQRCAFDIAADTAIAALRAMKAPRGDDDH